MNIHPDEFRAQHEAIKFVIIELRKRGVDRGLISSLVGINRFLHDSMVLAMLDKDEFGIYIYQENYDRIRKEFEMMEGFKTSGSSHLDSLH